MPKTVLPVLQNRSRETQARLLKAAVEILDERGVEGATIPRIAARAKVSAGAVYRRFPNKDALMREVCLRALQSNDRYSSTQLRPEHWEGKPLSEIIAFLVKSTVEGHLIHRRLLRGMMYFAMEHSNVAFVRQMEELQWKTFRSVSGLVLSRRDEIHHPDPEAAVSFALLIIGISAQGVAVIPRDPGDLFKAIPKLEANLMPELTQMAVAYLGARKGTF